MSMAGGFFCLPPSPSLPLFFLIFFANPLSPFPLSFRVCLPNPPPWGEGQPE
eukprot:EC688363.1.p5 GENE.EC688363.1~~EC688363.1.p5  ORF type:complete len:52 (+),score=5.33 EC688363.1:114-269(+)